MGVFEDERYKMQKVIIGRYNFHFNICLVSFSTGLGRFSEMNA